MRSALLAAALLAAGCSAGNSGSSYIPTPYTGQTLSISPATGLVQSTTVSGDMVFVKLGGLYVQETEVTMGQWKTAMGTTPWSDANVLSNLDGSMPALNVSWEEANAFASAMRTKTALSVRLPTSTEWKSWYAAAYPWGDDPNSILRSGYAQVRETAPFGIVRSAKTGTPYLGLYNLCGNAREWTMDGLLCGGGWSDNIITSQRAMTTASVPTSVRHPASGFRLVIGQ